MTDARSPAEARVTLGRIVGVYGVKGWVKVQSFTRPPDSILDYDQWLLGKTEAPVQLLEGKLHAGGLIAWIATADGQPMEDRDEAAKLIGAEIVVPRSALPPPEGDEIYLVDLIGMAVRASSGESLGVVEALTDNGAQDVLVVRDVAVQDDKGQPLQRLIPFVRGPIIESVQRETGVIVAHWQPEW